MMNIRHINKACRLGLLRLNASSGSHGWAWTIGELAVVPLIGLLFSSTIRFGIIGFIAICGLGAASMTPLMIQLMEEQDGIVGCNGFLPISRREQVLARYGLMLLMALASGLYLTLSMLVMMHDGPATVHAACVSGAALVLFGLAIGMVVTPLIYRFPATKALSYIMTGLFVVWWGGYALVKRFVPRWVIDGVTDFAATSRLGPVPSVVVIGAAIVAALGVLSYYLSLHIYERKEL